MAERTFDIPPEELVTIDDDGRVLTPAKVRDRLRGRRGAWRLVPTVDDLVVLHRLDGAPAQNSHAILAGDIAGLGTIADLTTFISSSQWTGVLAVLHEDIAKSVYFKRGDVKAASSNYPEDRLGDIIYRYGGITREQLEEALAEITESRKIGKVLVEKNFINAHRLWHFIRTQIEEIFYSILLFRDGSFYFYPRSEDEFHTSLTLSTQNLLMEGIRRIDEIGYFRQKIPSKSVIVERRMPQPEGVKLHPKEEQILALADGHRSVEEVSRESRLGEFEAMKILYHLIENRFIVVTEKDICGGLPHAEGRIANVIEAFNSIFRKIYGEVRRKAKESSLRAGLEAFFSGASGFAELFKDAAINEDGALDPETILANLDRVDVNNKVDFLYHGLNELLFFELFAAGETLDRTEEQNLQRILNDLFREISGN